jgi:hypothetical protein
MICGESKIHHVDDITTEKITSSTRTESPTVYLCPYVREV